MSVFQNVPVRSRLLGAFGVVLVILITLSSAAYRTISLNQTANDWVTHSLEVVSAANGTLTTLVDMETSYRGFLLSGDEVFLIPYLQGVSDVDLEIANLVQLTADNPSQIARWRSIERQVADWRSQVTERGIALRRQIRDGQATQDQMNAFVATGEGRMRFAAIRASFREAIEVEEEFLAERQKEAAAAGALLQTVLIGGTLLATAVSLALALLLTSTIVGPITRLATTAQAIAGGDVNRRVGLARGDEIGVAAAAFDRMTEQLQVTITRSEAILDTAAEGIVGLDSNGRVTFINPAAVRLFDSTETALLGSDAEGWIVQGPTETVANADDDGLGPIARALRRGQIVTGAGDLVRPDDERPSVAVEYACSPIREYGEIRGAVLTFRDITERRAAQRALEDRNRELARSNADLEQFAYVASHDLQEPLRAIVSYLQLLERRYAPQLDERANRYIGHAVEGGHRMQTLISDLLTYSRVGRRGEEMTQVSMRGVFDRALSNLQIAIEESEAVVTYDEPLPTVTADATQMYQLLQNLLANAIKFRGENAPRIHLWAERIDGGWQFSVRDNGIGIAPEYRDRVFVLFQRLHGRDEYAGTGIGLAVCKKIVERHGGQLWVESTEGGGSTFHFTIPDPDTEGAAA